MVVLGKEHPVCLNFIFVYFRCFFVQNGCFIYRLSSMFSLFCDSVFFQAKRLILHSDSVVNNILDWIETQYSMR
jgi:hypothetical protein